MGLVQRSQRATRKKSCDGSLALPGMPVSGGGFSVSSNPAPGRETPLGQARLDWITDPLRAFEIFRWKRGEWFETITGDPETYPNAVLLARAEELGAKIAGLKRALTRPPVGMTGEAWEGEAERLARLEGQQAAIADVLGMREAAQRGLSPPERSRWLALGKSKASEAASPCTASPALPDPFEGE